MRGMASIRERFGKAVRRLREGAGYSQEGFAAVAGIHRTYYSKIERGLANVTIEVAERIAKALRLSLGKLFAAVDSE